MNSKPLALVIEPNTSLAQPYNFISSKLELMRANSIKQSSILLSQQTFDCFIVSSSFSPEKMVNLLDSLKFSFKDRVIPLLFIVDASQPLSVIPGISWDNKLAILSSTASQKLTLSTIESLLSA